NAFSITFNGADTVAPTVTVTSPATSPTNVSPISFTATFSEDVTGFSTADVTVTNGTVGKFLAGDARTYTFSVTPTADGPVSVSIPAGVAQDAAANANTASNPLSITFDTTAPTATTTSTAPDPTRFDPIPVTVTFNEDVTGFTLG